VTSQLEKPADTSLPLVALYSGALPADGLLPLATAKSLNCLQETTLTNYLHHVILPYLDKLGINIPCFTEKYTRTTRLSNNHILIAYTRVDRQLPVGEKLKAARQGEQTADKGNEWCCDCFQAT